MDIRENNAGQIVKDAIIGHEHMNHYLDSWANKTYMFNYLIQENSLNELFKEYPSNTNPIEVWKKCSMLDSYYSTNLKEGMWDMVLNITNPDVCFDDLVHKGNWNLINAISSVYSAQAESGRKEAISFASKYCSRIEPEKYPIYDKYVRQMLSLIEKYHPFLKNKNDIKNIDKDYILYSHVVDEFCHQDCFGDGIDYKTADRYLWTWAKEIVTRDYLKDKIKYYSNKDNNVQIEKILKNIFE